MKTPFIFFTRLFALALVIVLFTSPVAAQDDYKNAMQEMREAFGTVPAFFEVFPKDALPGVWEYFKAMDNPNAELPRKYRELLQLAVAAQIPCKYCVYFHTAAARAYGATEGELREAVAQAAATRHWSIILQGNKVDYEDFKEEVDQIFAYLEEMNKS